MFCQASDQSLLRPDLHLVDEPVLPHPGSLPSPYLPQLQDLHEDQGVRSCHTWSTQNSL